MGKKLDKVYNALLRGAVNGLAGDRLYKYVMNKCPKTSSKRVVRASLLALTDPDVEDRAALETIYALAIEYRLAALGIDDDFEQEADPTAPSISNELKAKLASSVSPLPTETDGSATLPDLRREN